MARIFAHMFLLTMLIDQCFAAGLYRCVDVDGRVVYSDVICDESPEQVKLNNVGEDQPTLSQPSMTGNMEVDLRRMGFTNRDHYRMALENCKSFTPGTDSWRNASCDQAFALSNGGPSMPSGIDLIGLQNGLLDGRQNGLGSGIPGFQRLPVSPQSGVEELWYQASSSRLIVKIAGVYREHCPVDQSIVAGFMLDPDAKGYYERNVAALTGNCGS